MYQLPRVMALMNWAETFGGKRAYYPFNDLPMDLVSFKATGGIGDTFIQQLHQDLPGELARAVLLEPAATNLVGSRGYLDEVKKRLDGHGVDIKRQFLDFDPRCSPRQHLQVSPAQNFFDSLFEGSRFTPRRPCLRTVSSAEQGAGLVCYGCSICDDAVRNPLFNRELGRKVSLEEVRAVKQKNAPSFYYTFIFSIPNEGRFVSKSSLVRLWFKELAKADESYVGNFRNFSYSFSRHMDYLGMVSNYTGYEAAVAGFRDRIDLDRLREISRVVNERCPTVKFYSVLEAGEKPRVPDLWVLSRLQIGLPASCLDEVVRCFTDNPFRKYTGSMYRFTEVSLPFYYRASVAGDNASCILELCYPAKVNASYSLMRLYSYNKFNRLLLDNHVGWVLSLVGDGCFKSLTPEWDGGHLDGFTYVDRGRI